MGGARTTGAAAEERAGNGHPGWTPPPARWLETVSDGLAGRALGAAFAPGVLGLALALVREPEADDTFGQHLGRERLGLLNADPVVPDEPASIHQLRPVGLIPQGVAAGRSVLGGSETDRPGLGVVAELHVSDVVAEVD